MLMVDVVMVDVATPFPRFKDDTVIEDPTNVENCPAFRLRVEIPIVDAN
jgi:hypothetical protein